MFEKDHAEKKFISRNENFSDITNLVLFGGKKNIQPTSLTAASTESFLKDLDGNFLSQYRDFTNYVTEDGAVLAIIGIENQTKTSKHMVLRIAGYNGSIWLDQFRHLKDSEAPYPVFTIVVYFGTSFWNYEPDFYKYLDLPENLESFVDNIRLNIVQLAFLTDEEIGLLSSDFKYLALYLRSEREGNNDYVVPYKKVRHPEEFFDVIYALGGSNFFERMRRAQGGFDMMKDVDHEMSDAEKWCKLYEEKKIAEGEEKATLANIKALVSNPEYHCSPEKAMDIFGIAKDQREKYLIALKNS